MFGSRSRRTTTAHHSTATHHTKRRGLFSRGPTRAGRATALKGAINNPNTTSHGVKHAKHELRAMGVKPPKERLSTKLRRMLHLGGRSKNRTRTTTTRTRH